MQLCFFLFIELAPQLLSSSTLIGKKKKTTLVFVVNHSNNSLYFHWVCLVCPPDIYLSLWKLFEIFFSGKNKRSILQKSTMGIKKD